MSFLKRFKKIKKDENSIAFRREMAEHLNGRIVKYVSERDSESNTDIIIGKEGSITVYEGALIVLSSQNIVFRCEVDSLKASELMSLEGAILEGPDLEHGGKMRKIIAYYKYYR